MNLKEKILEFTSDDGVLYQSEELSEFIKDTLNESINNSIKKIESETFAYYSSEEVIEMLEDLKATFNPAPDGIG